ncbi:MAG: hypothetical protein ACRD2G_06300 [Terriglobia bacterium]
MKTDIAQYFQLMDQRLDTLWLLAGEIGQAEKALVALDFDLIAENTSRQQNLCDRLAQIDRETRKLHPGIAFENTETQKYQLSELRRKIQAAEEGVRRGNRRQMALWQSLRRTLQAVQSALPTNEAGLYEPFQRSQAFVAPAMRAE